MEKKNNDPIISPIGNPITSVRTVKNNDAILRENIDEDELSAVTGGSTDNGRVGDGAFPVETNPAGDFAGDR